MSLINVNGQVDQNAAAQLAAQLAQIIQAAPNTPEKANFIRDLAAQLGVSAPEQNVVEDDNDVENRVDYRDEHEYDCYNDGHDNIEQRGKLVFIDDHAWDEDLAYNIFDNDPNDYCCRDFDDVSNSEGIDIDQAIANVGNVVEKLAAAKRTLEKCRDDGGRYVIWNNDDEFDYKTGDPEDI